MNQLCSNCGKKDDCGQVYNRLGHSEGPSVVLKAITAFLAPMLVFIAALAATEKLLSAFEPSKWLVVVQVVAATVAVVVYISVLLLFAKTGHKNRHLCNGRGRPDGTVD